MRPGSKPPSRATVPPSSKCQRERGIVSAIRERSGRRALGQDEVAAHQACDSPSVVGRDRHLHSHDAGSIGHVPLPSHPEEREALTHERAVAELRLGRRIGAAGRFLKCGEHRLAAAVADFVEQPAVAAPRVDGHEQVEVSAELDLAIRVARRELQIDDVRIAGEIRIEREVDLADDLLVGADGAERAAAENRLAPLDAEPDHPRLDGRCSHSRQRDDGDTTETRSGHHFLMLAGPHPRSLGASR